MHIPDGMLPLEVCAAAYAVTAIATGYSLKKIKQMEEPRREIPKASLVTAAFFVASWIHIPIPPTSVHLVLNGLVGALLGYFAFPAVLIALFFQAVMFQHGGLTSLGVNALIMGIPAMICASFFRLWRPRLKKGGSALLPGFLLGVLGLGLSVVLFFLVLINFIPANIDAEAEKIAIYGAVTAHIPLILIEGVFSGLVLNYLNRVKPEIFDKQ